MFHISIKKAALALLLLPLGFTACSDDDPEVNGDSSHPQPETPASRSFYVICQGNQYGGVSGSIQKADMDSKTVTGDYFFEVNKQGLGDTPQKAVRYGSKIYIPVFGSDLVWVLDGKTLKQLAYIRTKAPQAVCGVDGYLFIANNDGHVTRVDTLGSREESSLRQVYVGPNPMGLAKSGDNLLVTISDGYNYENGYVNGKRVVALDYYLMDKTAEYKVGVNPTQIVTNELGEAFVVCQGNYADVLPKVQKISTEGEVTDYCDGSMITGHGNDLYVLNVKTDYAANKVTTEAAKYETLTNVKHVLTFEPDAAPLMPVGLDVNAANGHVFICSDNGPTGYDKNGFVYEYKPDGSLVYRYDVGIHPFGVIFE